MFADPCNDHCASCPFACHSEAEDGHTPEYYETHPNLKNLQDRVNELVEGVEVARRHHVVNYVSYMSGYDYEVQP